MRLFFYFAAVCLLIACNQTPVHNAVFTQDDTAVELARDVEILYSDSAVVRVRITSALMHNFVDRTNPRQSFPEGIKVEFLSSDTRVQSILTAKNALREQEKSIVTARDSVVMTTIKQEKLETEELIWDEKAARLRTDKFVKVSKPGEVMYGFGLEANQDFSYWKILVPKGRIKVDQAKEFE